MHLSWEKSLTASEALRPNKGSLMPFLRLTKSGMPHDHKTWFRQVLFSDLDWYDLVGGRQTADLQIRVIILGVDMGVRTMNVDYRPSRSANNSAPTTHLIYDGATKTHLFQVDLTGRTVRLFRDLDSYRFEIL